MSHFQEEIKNICQTVYNQLGCGHSEFVYQTALKCELDSRDITTDTERPLSIHYIDSKNRQHLLTSYRIDLYVFGPDYDVVIEVKNISSITDKEICQVKRYLSELDKEMKNVPYGIIVNFPKTNKDIEFLVVNKIN